MDQSSRAIELVAAHCDILERLKAIPPAASVRGIFFRNLERQVENAGRLPEYRTLFASDHHGALPFYPLGDYLLRLACAGAIIESPAELHRGMFSIARSYATTFAESLLGRALIRLLSRDPVRLSEQGLAAKRQTHNYGHWEIVRHGPSQIEMRYEDEFQWIESVMVGAASGTFESCGITAHLETQLRGPYRGSTFVRW
jgi:uncharacterized protein (TIGR02265 family)